MYSNNLGIETDCDWGVPILQNTTSNDVDTVELEWNNKLLKEFLKYIYYRINININIFI